MAAGADEYYVFVLWKVQIFEGMAEGIDSVERNQLGFGDVAAKPFIRLPYVNYVCSSLDHFLGFVGANRAIG